MATEEHLLATLNMAEQRKVDSFNRALGMFLKWGPEQQVDIRERIAKAVPGLQPAEIRALLSEFEALRSAACRIVEAQVEKHQAEEDGRSLVAALDARMSATNASLLYHEARYSAWRDGYR
jgi:hypothetical protein